MLLVEESTSTFSFKQKINKKTPTEQTFVSFPFFIFFTNKQTNKPKKKKLCEKSANFEG